MSSHAGRPRLVVVGGDAAGMSAASQARRLAPELEIVVLEQGPHISYAACGIPLVVSGRVSDPAALQSFTPESAAARRGLDVRIGRRVTRLDLREGAVHGVEVDGGEPFRLGFDRLVLATGARPLRPPLPGVDLPGVFTIRRLEQGLRLAAWLDERRPQSAVIAGAGLVGLDLAEALRARGLGMTILKKNATPLLDLEPELSVLAEEALARSGCVLLRDAPLYALEGGAAGNVEAVRAGGERIPADLVVLAMGVSPCAELAAEAGIELGAGGAIAVNRRTETSARGVYAAGDCATQHHRLTGETVHVTQALAANRQGRVAGANAAQALAGRRADREHSGTLGTVVRGLFDAELGRTGLGLGAAREAKFDAYTTVIGSRNRAGYHPGSGPVKVALIAERRTGRLLGGQIVGAPGAAKRIDVVATAIHAGLDLAALAELDLGYAPGFSPVRDPLLVAARAALKRL
ncbi:MAG: FAD-dependent oxidoreductase [bacterium]